MGGILCAKYPKEGLAAAASEIDQDDLCAEYEARIQSAPDRAARDKAYFVGHNGKRHRSNRREEHLAIALCNLKERWPRPDGGWLRLLDYQFPLYARESDRLRKIDLVGVTNQGRFTVIELKVERGNNSATPLGALMQGLRYAAAAQANLDTISGEAERLDARIAAKLPPIVQILAPKAWWRIWLKPFCKTRDDTGDWVPEFVELVGDIEKRLDIAVECVALADIRIGDRPQLAKAPAFYPVLLDGKQLFGACLPHEPQGG